jgi:putative endonuclease
VSLRAFACSRRVRSSPGVINFWSYSGGAVAQLGARLDGIEEVVGSNPIGSTNNVLSRIAMSFHVYILRSESTNRFYIGQTQNVEERLQYHNANYSKSLKNRGPWKLLYQEAYQTRSEAVSRERQIKSWKDRAMIERLVGASR